MTKILVIGCGYIGTMLINSLIDKSSYTVTVVDSGKVYLPKEINLINVKYQDLPDSFFVDFDIIILLAAQGSVSNSKNLDVVFNNSILNFKRIIQLIQPHQKFIYASSSSVYGKTDTNTADETQRFGEPYNYYDFGKQMIDNLATLHFKDKKCSWYGLRFGTVNGFSYNLRNDLMMNSMIYNAKKNGEIYVTNKEIYRPILGINDLCKGILIIIKDSDNKTSGIYNFNSFNNTVENIANLIAEKCNVPIINGENTNKMINFKLQSKAYDFQINSSKFEKVFNFKFTDTLDSITNDLLINWDNIINIENRLPTISDYNILNSCRICKEDTTELLDLKSQPLANEYHKLDKPLIKYPLKLMYCKNCFHVQLNTVVNPDKLFKNYIYTSGTSNTLKEYFNNFAVGTLIRYGYYNEYNLKPKTDLVELKILDIACNDASQLDSFEKIADNCGFKLTTIGVDPAENIYNTISKNKNHDIHCEFFTQETVDKLKTKYHHFDIIIAQNVFAHIDNPNEFLKLTKQLMNSQSMLFIQTSQKNMIKNGEFDTAYHEHLSFFNTNSMNLLCKQTELLLNKSTEVNIHGNSYLFEILNNTKNTIDYNINDQLSNEIIDNLYSIEFYEKYAMNCIMYKNIFHNYILQYKLQNKNIIGYGSTAKSNVLLNFCNISNEIDWIIDENPLKQGLYTPGSNILIKSIDSLKEITNGTVIVIFAWNFFNEVKDKILKYTKNVIILNINPLQEFNPFFD